MNMTQKSIDEQIEVLKIVAEKFSVSREAASEFLISAGIYPNGDVVVNPRKDKPFSRQQPTNDRMLPGKSLNRNKK
jgi:hypothetical protein